MENVQQVLFWKLDLILLVQTKVMLVCNRHGLLIGDSQTNGPRIHPRSLRFPEHWEKWLHDKIMSITRIKIQLKSWILSGSAYIQEILHLGQFLVRILSKNPDVWQNLILLSCSIPDRILEMSCWIRDKSHLISGHNHVSDDRYDITAC